jgi:DNA repair exonuclease SbcCD ATPase subunit
MLQKGTTQFFTLPALEKRRFIESLAKRHNNLDTTRERIQNKLKELKTLLLAHQTRLEVITRSSPRPPEPCDAIDLGLEYESDLQLKQILPPTKLFYKQQLDHSKKLLQSSLDQLSLRQLHHSRKVELQTSLQNLHSSLDSIHSRLSSLDYSSLDSLEATTQAGRHNIEYQKKKAELLQAKRNYEELVRQEDKELQSRITLLQQQILSVESIDQKDLETAEQNYLQTKRHKELSLKLPPETDLTEQTLLVNRFKERISQAQQRKTIIGCPHCTKGLIIKGSTIDRADAGPLSREEKQLVEEATQRLPVEEKKLLVMVKQNTLREQILAELDTLSFVKDAEQIYLDLKKKSEEMKAISQKNSILQQQIKQLKQTTAKDKYALLRSQYEKELELFKSMPKGESVADLDDLCQKLDQQRHARLTSIDLQKQKEDLEEQILLVGKQLESISVESGEDISIETHQQAVAQMEEKLQRLDQVEGKLGQVEDYHVKRKEFKQWERNVTALKEIVEMTTREIMTLELFLRRLGEAETKCLEDTIQLLNNKTKAYLEKFFTDDPISIEIATEKESKKGVKTEIALRINYKGEECDLSSLSGGEYDRCALAFLLAVNEVCGSPLLILDESIGSLDMNNAENVLEVLKDTIGTDKIVILVQHQATCGSYDHVLKV